MFVRSSTKNLLISILFILSITVFGAGNAQKKEKKNYVDLVIKDRTVFGLTDSGQVNEFNINTAKTIDTNLIPNVKITAINIDKNKNILIANTSKKIELFDSKTKNLIPLYTAKGYVNAIVFDSKDRVYLITNKGIENILTRKTYLPDTSFRLNKYITGWLTPSAVFMDKDDNIWIGLGRGEWGGELFIFSTKTSKFIKPAMKGTEIDISPVKSIFSDGNAIYISCGLQHFSTSGSIIKFNNFKGTSIFASTTHLEKQGADIGKMIKGEYKGPAIIEKRIDGEYLGPAAYNDKDSSIYFYSQNGLFKSHKNESLSEINHWDKIIAPRLHWRYGQPDAVGSPMNVLKMIFDEDGVLYLVTQNDGIGIFKGKAFNLMD